MSWTELAGPPATTVSAVAGLPDRIWMITDRGLVPAMPVEAAVRAAAACCEERPERVRERGPTWIWPTVTATVTIDRTATRRTVAGFLLLRFPFDRPPAMAALQSALAAEWARRDGDRIRAELAAAAEPGAGAGEDAP